jgi:hypothetical protein
MIRCNYCGSTNVKVDFDKVFTSIPPKLQYECKDCGCVGYVDCDEVNHNDFDSDGCQKTNESLNETLNTPKEKPNTGLMGWICPKCGRCYSPIYKHVFSL